jgi:hypothetical protein
MQVVVARCPKPRAGMSWGRCSLLLIALASGSLAACSGDAISADATAVGSTPPAEDPEMLAQTRQVDDVYTFFHEETSWSDALLGGSAHVADGCLYVDDAVVVWPAEDFFLIETLIRWVSARGPLLVSFGGGGRTRDEGDPFERDFEGLLAACPTSTVLFSAPLPASWPD